jgi:hypothetical protein
MDDVTYYVILLLTSNPRLPHLLYFSSTLVRFGWFAVWLIDSCSFFPMTYILFVSWMDVLYYTTVAIILNVFQLW